MTMRLGRRSLLILKPNEFTLEQHECFERHKCFLIKTMYIEFQKK